MKNNRFKRLSIQYKFIVISLTVLTLFVIIEIGFRSVYFLFDEQVIDDDINLYSNYALKLINRYNWFLILISEFIVNVWSLRLGSLCSSNSSIFLIKL